MMHRWRVTGSRPAPQRGRPPLLLAGVVALVMAAAGCTSGDHAGGGDGRIQVVASFYPLFEAARRVGGDAVEVTNLTPPGVEPHDLELTADQVDQLLGADLVVYLGQGFQPAVEQIVAKRSKPSLDLLAGVDLVDGEGGRDPHIWLDPTNMIALSERVETALTDRTAAGGPAFAANLATYRAELELLDDSFATGLADCPRRELVTTHAAFTYLARRYGLTQVGISGLSPDAEPDAGRLAELADQIRRDGVTTVFFESLVSPDVARTLAREAGVTTAVLDPLEGLTEAAADAGATYDSVMRQNLATLQNALGCG